MLGVEFTDSDIGKLVIGTMVHRGVIAAYTLNNPRSFVLSRPSSSPPRRLTPCWESSRPASRTHWPCWEI